MLSAGLALLPLTGDGWRLATNSLPPSSSSSPRNCINTSSARADFSTNFKTPCGVNCGPGPATLPDGKTFIYDISHQLEVASTIMTVYATWPSPGQI